MRKYNVHFRGSMTVEAHNSQEALNTFLGTLPVGLELAEVNPHPQPTEEELLAKGNRNY